MKMNKRMDQLKNEQIRIEKQYKKQLSKIKSQIYILQDKLSVLDKEYSRIHFEMRQKHYEYEHKIQKICKHDKYPVRKRENMRDDASFKYWVSCSNCGIDLRHE